MMDTTRLQALKDLREKVKSGAEYETMGHTRMCQRAFPNPESFDGSREAYEKSPAQYAVLIWRNDSLDAAKALHEAVLPGWKWSIVPSGGEHRIGVWPSTELSSSSSAHNKFPARAWLLAILSALIAIEGEQ